MGLIITQIIFMDFKNGILLLHERQRMNLNNRVLFYHRQLTNRQDLK